MEGKISPVSQLSEAIGTNPSCLGKRFRIALGTISNLENQKSSWGISFFCRLAAESFARLSKTKQNEVLVIMEQYKNHFKGQNDKI